MAETRWTAEDVAEVLAYAGYISTSEREDVVQTLNRAALLGTDAPPAEASEEREQ